MSLFVTGFVIGVIVGAIVVIFTASIFDNYMHGLNKKLKKENAKLRSRGIK